MDILKIRYVMVLLLLYGINAQASPFGNAPTLDAQTLTRGHEAEPLSLNIAILPKARLWHYYREEVDYEVSGGIEPYRSFFVRSMSCGASLAVEHGYAYGRLRLLITGKPTKVWSAKEGQCLIGILRVEDSSTPKMTVEGRIYLPFDIKIDRQELRKINPAIKK